MRELKPLELKYPIQLHTRGNPGCVFLELMLLIHYLYSTFTYRYSAQITKEYLYQNLQIVLCNLVENSLFLPFFLSALGETSRSLADHQGPLLSAGNSHSYVLLLLRVPVTWGISSLRLSWELLAYLLIGNGPLNPRVRRCQGSDVWCLSSESHTPLLLRSSCPASAWISPAVLLHLKLLIPAVPSVLLKSGWLSDPMEQFNCLEFSFL